MRGNLTLRNDSATAQKNISLQISSSLGWRSIQLDGKPVQFVSSSMLPTLITVAPFLKRS